MKKIIYNLFMCLIFAGFVSCEDDTTEDTSKITYYATLELQGESTVFWDKDVAYVDPGYTAEMAGEDVTSQVVVSGTVDVATPGVYELTYTITNEDGFAVNDHRTIMVSDPTPSEIQSGLWTSAEGTYRTYKGVTTEYSGFDVAVIQTAPGEFYISDFFGGYYDQRAGYGSRYAMVGSFGLAADNTITAISAHLEGWDDSINGLENGKFNPETGEIYYEVTYVGGNMRFYVTLTKK